MPTIAPDTAVGGKGTRDADATMELIMRKTTPALFAVAAILAATLSVPAHAQATRTWVSGNGIDNDPCSRQLPCKTLAFAITKTAAGGEIAVLDPGGFAPVTITKAISIVSESGSGEAVVANFGPECITINAGPTDIVILRGLVIDGLQSATAGIHFNSGGALHVENSIVKNVRGANGVGINFAPNAAADLHVSNTTLVFNGSVNGGGIAVKPSGSGLVRAVFDRVVTKQNVVGLLIDGSASTGTIRATVRDSMIATNSGSGLWARSPAGAATSVFLVNSAIVENATTGISAEGANATVVLLGSSIMGNSIGISAPSGGKFYSYKTNAIGFNFSSDGAVAPGNVLPLN